MLDFLVLVVVGAVIGFGTNLLAIIMLFRPWKPWKVFGFKVPLTPGLIPKRQADIAEKLGEVVEQHLLTEAGIVAALRRPEWIPEVRSRLVGEAGVFLAANPTPRDLYRTLTNLSPEAADERIKSWVSDLSRQQIFPLLEARPLKALIPASIQQEVNKYIINLADIVLEKGQAWIDTPAVRSYLATFIQEQLMGRGMLGKMASMFLQEDRIVNEIVPLLQNSLNSPSTSILLQNKLREEWERLLEQPVTDILAELKQPENEGDSTNALILLIAEILEKLFSVNVYQKWAANRTQIEKWIDRVLQGIQLSADKWVKPILGSLPVGKIVEQEIAAFPVQKLEKITVDVVRKELSMITWLGALLGGLIGLIQALWILGWK